MNYPCEFCKRVPNSHIKCHVINCQNVFCNRCLNEGKDYGYLIEVYKGGESFQKRVVLCSDCSEDDELLNYGLFSEKIFGEP